MLDFEVNDDGLKVFPTLHKRDTRGKHRTWRMELDGNRYRTVSGLADGAQTETGWTVIEEAKSQDTVEAQAQFEVEAKYRHQLDREYHETAATIDTPKMIQPLLAKTYKKFPGAGYAQPKLDGMRCIMTKAGAFTREGQPITAVPHLHASAKPLFDAHPSLILDGELYNHDLSDEFQKLMSICRKKAPTAEEMEAAEVVQYHCYDLVDTTAAFEHRYARLTRLLEGVEGWIKLVDTIMCTTEEAFDEAYAEFVAAGYEGGIFRPNGDEGYALGSRSPFLLKRKDFDTDEFEVVRVEEGKGNWAGAAKRFVLKRDGIKEFGSGTRGSYDEMVEVLKNPPSDVTLRYFGLTDDGVPRFPVVIDMHYGGRKD